MLRYTDDDGGVWDVVIGRESFGALLALFVPAAGNAAGARQTMLGADSRTGADAELDAMSTAELDGLFKRSKPKDT